MKTAMQIIMAFTGTVAFSILFNVPKKYYFFCGLTGSVGWSVYLIINHYFHNSILATFIASMILTAMSRILSVKCKASTTLFLLCGIFTLVPGAGIYYMAYYIFINAGHEAMLKGIESIKIALAISLGIGVAYSIPAKVFGWEQESEVWNEIERRSKKSNK
ncbi:threonine/serine exporter [Acidilutibacter cellobiosedens]|uniref:Threonine/serine exporter n=1 Tax=Acidilutibacter cellobiosedens TaxID=2507161 RepID=A0A410QFX1_9FIRM|nr:threonine/serine exporter family protein [Acidilutibacter cellobiosedens]QAT62901.1 threonine/serine exporter [Acidilutibacter cellobiosedens]